MKIAHHSMIVAAALLGTGIGVGTAMAKEQKPPHIYGPAPEWSRFRERAESAIISRLIDPDSARIKWLGGFYKGEFKPFLERRVAGYTACGLVNARNRMGGYTGDRVFVVVIDNDMVLYADIDSSDNGLLSTRCFTARSNGLFPPVPADTASSRFAPASSTGLSLRVMPEGAYVSAVAPGSLADRAGVKPGMVIESINAISLKGMGDAMVRVIEAAGAKASLGLIGGKNIAMGE
jgi:hypothetical protein